MLFKCIKMLMGVVILGLVSQVAYAHGMSEADKQAIIDGGNLLFMWIGATHMLSGYDHLAFVFGIIFFLSNFRDIVKYVSAFTVGHSITLIYATFNGIQLNYFLIDAVIALSVCYIAFANIDGFRKYLNINPPNMMFMIVALGLIHGFGLSTRLQELPLSVDSLLMNIISFNIGIELGQITALALMLLLIAAWRNRHSFKAFSLIANYSLILAGGFLFLMQMHDYSHDSEPDHIAVAAEIIQVPNQQASSEDSITITVPARGDIEYKFLLNKNSLVEYAWKTDGTELFFDFHGDPKGDTTGYFKSYKKDTLSQDDGAFTAPFDGKHGWYWENKGNKPVQVTLELKGLHKLITKAKPDVKDSITVIIPARGDLEYKVMVGKAATIQYAWETDGTELFFDFHGDPKGDTTGYFKSYKKGSLSQDRGSLTAPFDGKHGWYWENNSNKPVEVVLELQGAYQLMQSESSTSSDLSPDMEPMQNSSDFLDLEPASK